MPLYISWSGLRRWEECKMHHRLVLARKQSPTADVRIFLPGTVADRVMRAWLSQEDEFGNPVEPRAGQMVELLDDIYELYARNNPEGVIRWRGQNDYYIVKNFVRELLKDLEPILLEKVVPYAYQPEYRFSTPIRIPYPGGGTFPIMLVGGMDVVVCKDHPEPASQWAIYDLKATANPDYWKKTVAQLPFYDIALQADLGLKVAPSEHALIQPKTFPQFLPLKVTQNERDAMMARIIRFAHGMLAKDWTATKGEHCRNCECKHACPEWQPNTTIDERGRKRASFGRR